MKLAKFNPADYQLDRLAAGPDLLHLGQVAYSRTFGGCLHVEAIRLRERSFLRFSWLTDEPSLFTRLVFGWAPRETWYLVTRKPQGGVA